MRRSKFVDERRPAGQSAPWPGQPGNEDNGCHESGDNPVSDGPRVYDRRLASS
jgi:hypothetical protein